MSASNSYDYIIVGAGPAGLTLASRLSTSLLDESILLVEAGVDPTHNPNVTTIAGYSTLTNGDSEQAYNLSVVANPNLNNRSSLVCVGKALSGSTAINGGAWTRGPKTDYDLWANTVDDDAWSYDNLLPFFRRTESDNSDDWKDEVQHGYAGTITATPISKTRKFPLRDALQQAWSEFGVPYKGDANDGHPNGVTDMTEVWQHGIRQLPHKLLHLSRVTILEGTQVSRVLFDQTHTKPKASGIQLLDGKIISARQEVILSTGVYHTPQLLMLSGLGPPDILNKHSIPIIHANTHVGAHLKDHLAVAAGWKLTDSAISAGSAFGHPEFMKHPEFFLGWPMDFITFTAMPSSTIPTLEKLNPSPADKALVCRDTATHMETVFLYFPAAPKNDELAKLPVDGTYICSLDVLLTPTSQGSVSINSSNPRDPPVIDVNFNATESDRFILRQAMRQTASALTTTESGKSFVREEAIPSTFKGMAANPSDEDLNARIAQFGMSMDHPMGSCRMAPTSRGDDGGVVDSRCRVFGVEGLRVVDASVFPVPIAAHIQAAVYALGERAAAMIVEDATATAAV